MRILRKYTILLRYGNKKFEDFLRNKTKIIFHFWRYRHFGALFWPSGNILALLQIVHFGDPASVHKTSSDLLCVITMVYKNFFGTEKNGT